MSNKDLLGKTFQCECGREHAVPTEHFHYASDAAEFLAATVGQYVSEPAYLILADERTHEVAGRLVESHLKSTDALVRVFIVPDKDGHSPSTDTKTRDYILREAPSASAYIAAGSGVINDLTKWIAFENRKPFFSFATAASMNGYASANVAASNDGLKVLYHGHPSKGVFAIPGIIENAPFELTTSGLGDALAKPVSSADWKLNQVLFDEYYCQFSVDLLDSLVARLLERSARIADRHPEAIQTLFETLFYSGVAMTIVGTSVPASGGEHLISHTIDMTSAVQGKEHDYHGRQVGVGTILSAALYEWALSVESPDFRIPVQEIASDFWGPLSDVVGKEFKKKGPKYELAVQKLSQPGAWDNLRTALCDLLISPQRIKDCLKQAGGAHLVSDLRVDGRAIPLDQFLDVFRYAYQMRERFTILDLCLILGITDTQMRETVAQWAT
ncbi:MAG: iron-containing alcohol dehydrogenase [Deltaproteobacteria bacterium]|nr:iron-containing alcohol dehydrogenase [Deltaproteobacteria bacterium]